MKTAINSSNTTMLSKELVRCFTEKIQSKRSRTMIREATAQKMRSIVSIKATKKVLVSVIFIYLSLANHEIELNSEIRIGNEAGISMCYVAGTI